MVCVSRAASVRPLHRFAGKWYRLISIGLVATIVLYVFFDNVYSYLNPISWMEIPVIANVGMIILLISLIIVLIAQFQMGTSWRIGIDEENSSELVTRGIFQFSRNPIFLGMRLSLLGLFLVLPNTITFTLLLLGDVLLQMQVILEEEYLLERHGEDYKKYLQKVRRWI